MNASSFIPPMVRGVSASRLYLPTINPAPVSVFEYLCMQFSHIAQQEWQQRFNDAQIYSETGEILTLHSPYIANTQIFYYRFLEHEPHVPFKHHILFENDDLLVVDKPHFLTMSPTGQYVQETLLVRLKNETGNELLTPIHRLDRETAGVVMFSKQAESRSLYQQLFAERKVQKTYFAIAPFCAELKFPLEMKVRMAKGNPFYTMKIVDGEPNSQTQIELTEHNDAWAIYKLNPHTGKQHQLRLHLSSLGIPIKNDPFYPSLNHKDKDDFSAPLQLLAKHLVFTDPVTKQKMHFSSRHELTL